MSRWYHRKSENRASGKQLNSGHPAAPTSIFDEFLVSALILLYFIPDLAADGSPTAERSCAAGCRICVS
jgi:hypothetical protein